ncbi:thioredoxin family protein [Nocardia sp. NPDC005978]|uniref:thioredoxin family protein n=1 Tax=unclassified Nocardia TaxID=2637762 RepID=UPI0033A962EA
MALESNMDPIGTPAPDFELSAVDGTKYSLAAFDDHPALLVLFLSNHCPYVRRIEYALGALTAEFRARGLVTVGICSNDTENYPDDDAAHLREQVLRAGFDFPYLVDESQEVAKAFRAACTPDLFLYDADRKLAYRGRFDAATPGNTEPADGVELRAAVELVLAGQAVPEPHTPSLGCGIKWKPGSGPEATGWLNR